MPSAEVRRALLAIQFVIEVPTYPRLHGDNGSRLASASGTAAEPIIGVYFYPPQVREARCGLDSQPAATARNIGNALGSLKSPTRPQGKGLCSSVGSSVDCGAARAAKGMEPDKGADWCRQTVSALLIL